MYRFVTLATVFFLLAPSAFSQTTRYVAPTGEDTSDCTVETNPCATISYATDQAGDGDTIDIADGTYTESFAIEKSLSLRGESEAGTIIQAHEEPGEATSRVVTIDGEYEVDISALTIRNGVAPGSGEEGFGGGLLSQDATLTISDVTFSENEANSWGGGMAKADSDAILTNVTFTGNNANRAGGLYHKGRRLNLTDVFFSENSAGVNGGGMYSVNNISLTLVNVTFSENSATQGTGGGMYNNGTNSAPPTLTNVSFSENQAGFIAGGMFNIENSPTLTNVHFEKNEAFVSGGMANVDNSSPTLTNVTFSGNSVSGGGGGMGNANNSSPTLTNVSFSGNIATAGGAMFNEQNSSPTLTNVTFSGNSADGEPSPPGPLESSWVFGGNDGGAMYNVASTPTLTNVIIWNNTAASTRESASASIFNDNSEPVISNSLIANSGGSSSWNDSLGVNDGNNIDTDPSFVETPNPDNAPTIAGDLRLTDGSPAIDAGDPDTDPLIFPTDEDGDPIDLDGNPRFFGEDDVIDMGPYENQGSVEAPENDNIADAVVLSESGTYKGSNVNATLEEDEPEPSCTFQDWTTNFSVWWSFTADANGLATIDTNGSLTPEEDGLDTILSLHNASDLSEVACDDDGGESLQSLIEDAPVSNGETYLIRVAGYNESEVNQGDIQLTTDFQFGVADEGTPEEVTEGLSFPRPNPASGASTFTIAVENGQDVTVEVFDATGRRVQTVYEGALVAGTSETLTLDASALPAGVYVVRATGEDFVQTRRVTVVR